jgi:hypothetical protein
VKELLKHGKRDAPVSLSEVITGPTIDGPSSIDQMLDSAVFTFKAELRKITKGNLLEMALSQREKDCLLGEVCPFLLEYPRVLFCVSEILGQRCQVERQRLQELGRVKVWRCTHLFLDDTRKSEISTIPNQRRKEKETMEQEKKEAQVKVETLEARLKEWGIDLERFRTKADETKGKAKAEREREVAALRAKLNEAQKKLEELKKAGDAASGELKKGIENAWGELKKAFDSATAKFK